MVIDKDDRKLSLEEAISKIPSDDEWWKSSTEEAYQKAADKLSEFGVLEQDVYDLLCQLYWATAQEFGG